MQTFGCFCRIAPVWTGLIITQADDSCSMKWSDQCSTPEWLPLEINSNMSDVGAMCFTVDTHGVLRRDLCNESRGFICEIEKGNNYMSFFWVDYSSRVCNVYLKFDDEIKNT